MIKTLYILLISVFIFGCYGRDPEKTGLEGKELPSFNLLLKDSVTVLNTNNIPTGESIVLFLFSPHCPFCRAQMKEITSHIDKLQGSTFYLITKFSFQEIDLFYKQYNLDKYKNIVVCNDNTGKLFNYYEPKGFPFIAIYGRDKKLNEAFLGKVSASQIESVAKL